MDSSKAGVLFTFLLAVSFTGSDSCSLRLNELMLTSLNATNEFIEVTTDCKLPLDLSSYSLALWRPNGSFVQIHSVAEFSKNLLCRTMNSSVLVIGNPDIQPMVSNTSDFCAFAGFASWPPTQTGNHRHFIDKGKKANALVLYKDMSSANLAVNTTLNTSSAFAANVADVVFYRSSSSSSGGGINKFFLPTYNVSQRGAKAPFYILTDRDAANVTQNDRHSFSFCCLDQTISKWPMGFKYSLPTPGEMGNECNQSFPYCLDSVGNTFPLFLDRCNVYNITHYNDETTTLTPLTSPAPQPGPTAAPDDNRTQKIGLGLGIPLCILVVCGFSFLAITLVKKRRYATLPDDGSRNCFPLNCFNTRDGSEERLILDH